MLIIVHVSSWYTLCARNVPCVWLSYMLAHICWSLIDLLTVFGPSEPNL